MMEGDDDTQTTAEGAGTEGSDGGESGHESSGSASDTSGTSDDTVTSGDTEAELRKELAAANREAAKFRKERNTAKSELDKIKESQLSEHEREKKRADDAEAKLAASSARVREANLKVALADSGTHIVDIDTATILLERRGVEYDDDDNPVGIKDAIDTLVKEKPFLVGKVASKGGNNAGAGNDDGEGSAGLTADELAMAKSFKMSPEEYAKWKDKP